MIGLNMADFTSALTEFLAELQKILAEIKANASATASPTPAQDSIQLAVFFDAVRPLFGKLSPSQVSGMEAKLQAYQEAGWPLSWAAYGLATSYHETAHRMQPVREGLSLSDAWRKKNLRYYPWYGRGDVQLTWEANYKRADSELELNGALIKNLDLALDPVISAKIMVKGMSEGWFSGDKNGRHTLQRHLPKSEANKAQFTQARRIINLLDKAGSIADIALKFQDALKKSNY